MLDSKPIEEKAAYFANTEEVDVFYSTRLKERFKQLAGLRKEINDLQAERAEVWQIVVTRDYNIEDSDTPTVARPAFSETEPKEY